jgi:2-amino-4-hydroxy-6-hydroxymethyldihydropteridine diphosphokinase
MVFQHNVYIGLGSNLEQPVIQIEHALRLLDALPKCQLIQSSSFYGSTPLGPQDQPDFVNAVCHIQTDLSPNELLNQLQSIEQQLGREKKRHWGERTIDLDILLYDQVIVDTEQLTIPHSQMHLRDFVLVPLQEIAPNIVLPDLPKLSILIEQLEESFIKPI